MGKWLESAVARQRAKGNSKPEQQLRDELAESRRRSRARSREVRRVAECLARVDPVSSHGALKAVARKMVEEE